MHVDGEVVTDHADKARFLAPNTVINYSNHGLQAFKMPYVLDVLPVDV
jgi:hypothetical protein